MRRSVFACLMLTAAVTPLRADIVVRALEYKQGDKVMEGLLVYDDKGGKKPGVLLAHEAGGNTPAARQRAIQWAKAGYAIFTCDLYGKGITPRDQKDAVAKAVLDQKDRKTVRARAEAALATLAKQPQVDGQRLAAVGYGTGGTAVLELARAGAELEGVVCVHGDLTTPTPEDAKKIGASVLVLVGTDDPLIPLAQLTKFEEAMKAGGVDWQVVRYGGVVHDFTNQQAGRNLAKGSAYDATADERAAEAIKAFLVEMFPPPKTWARGTVKLPSGVPDKVAKVLQHVDETGKALEGYEGGRTFLNIEKLLPRKDEQGRAIKYREWDVNPLKPGVSRGAERLVTGSDGSAHYTADHYKSFKKLR